MARRLAVLISALAVVATFAAPASATHVSCGDVITQDTTLDSASSTARATGS